MMSKRTTDVVAYLSWIGLLVAFVMGDRAASRFHLNQSLAIWLAGTVAGIAGRLLGWLPLVGWAADLAVGLMLVLCVVCWSSASSTPSPAWSGRSPFWAMCG